MVIEYSYQYFYESGLKSHTKNEEYFIYLIKLFLFLYAVSS